MSQLSRPIAGEVEGIDRCPPCQSEQIGGFELHEDDFLWYWMSHGGSDPVCRSAEPAPEVHPMTVVSKALNSIMAHLRDIQSEFSGLYAVLRRSSRAGTSSKRHQGDQNRWTGKTKIKCPFWFDLYEPCYYKSETLRDINRHFKAHDLAFCGRCNREYRGRKEVPDHVCRARCIDSKCSSVRRDATNTADHTTDSYAKRKSNQLHEHDHISTCKKHDTVDIRLRWNRLFEIAIGNCNFPPWHIVEVTCIARDKVGNTALAASDPAHEDQDAQMDDEGPETPQPDSQIAVYNVHQEYQELLYSFMTYHQRGHELFVPRLNALQRRLHDVNEVLPMTALQSREADVNMATPPASHVQEAQGNHPDPRSPAPPHDEADILNFMGFGTGVYESNHTIRDNVAHENEHAGHIQELESMFEGPDTRLADQSSPPEDPAFVIGNASPEPQSPSPAGLMFHTRTLPDAMVGVGGEDADTLSDEGYDTLHSSKRATRF